jgi:predicted extracellular nuclease
MSHSHLLKSITAAAALAVAISSVAAVGQVKISAIYGAGGNTNALINQDFVELYNTSATPVDVSGYVLGYGSGTGTTIATSYTFPASTTIAGNGYLLIATGNTTTVGTAIPATPDLAATTINAGGAAGRFILFSGAPAGTSSVYATINTDPALVDYVGYGTSTSFEGTAGPASLGTLGAQANNRLTYRLGAGATDTDDNAADFVGASLESAPNLLPAFRAGDIVRNSSFLGSSVEDWSMIH